MVCLFYEMAKLSPLQVLLGMPLPSTEKRECLAQLQLYVVLAFLIQKAVNNKEERFLFPCRLSTQAGTLIFQRARLHGKLPCRHQSVICRCITFHVAMERAERGTPSVSVWDKDAQRCLNGAGHTPQTGSHCRCILASSVRRLIATLSFTPSSQEEPLLVHREWPFVIAVSFTSCHLRLEGLCSRPASCIVLQTTNS